MTPAEVVTSKFGVRPLARKLGCTPSCVVRWETRGGQVPQKWHKDIIELAKGEITAEDLIYGRPDAD